MPTTITENSIKTVSKLIRKEFDAIDRTTDWIHEDSDRLIQTAKDFGLNELADEMTNDKRYW